MTSVETQRRQMAAETHPDAPPLQAEYAEMWNGVFNHVTAMIDEAIAKHEAERH